jgi:SAM-dependent methyltransferase
MWDIDNPGELSIGIESLQQSLLNGDLNPVCKHCNVKPVASTAHLQQELEAGEIKTRKEDIITDLLSIQEIHNSIPIPPPHLRYRISGTSDDKIFVHSGIIGSEQMMSYVDKYDPASERSLLDWGCGCGRYAHHITSKWPTVAYTGCDIDTEAINWCQTNLKQGHYVVTDPYPPTPFANEQFTSVIASSVMTHLTEANQQLWLGEIYRILKPGGIFVASVLGLTAASRSFWLPRKLKRKGFIDHHQDMALKGIAPDGYYRDVFQTEAYTRKNWSAFFDIKEYIPAGLMDFQDLVILQKKQ